MPIRLFKLLEPGTICSFIINICFVVVHPLQDFLVYPKHNSCLENSSSYCIKTRGQTKKFNSFAGIIKMGGLKFCSE